MNRKLISGIFILTILLSLGISYQFSVLNSQRIQHKLLVNLEETMRSHLKSMTSTIRNNLIQGNLRGSRVILEEMIYNELIVGYQIYEHSNIIESNVPEHNKFIKIKIDIFFAEDGEKWGSINYLISTTKIHVVTKETQKIFNTTLMILTGIILSIFSLFFLYIFHNDYILTQIIEDYFTFNFDKKIPFNVRLTWQPLILKTLKAAKISYQQKEDLIETENFKVLNKISRQVSHDIRSPLAALNVALEDISSLPEKNRTIIRIATQRINDIANNLLKKRDRNSVDSLDVTYVYPLLEELLSEKRLEYKYKPYIQITGKSDPRSNIFTIINANDFKRILSNLINNSVESLNSNGLISLNLQRIEDQAIFEITDNGKGIPKDILESLGKKNISYGKPLTNNSGFGLGVKHAYDTVHSWGGEINFSSKIDFGTTITISLPISPPPKWFLEKINIHLNQVILVLDDDREIHETWNKKFEHFPIELIHFFNTNDLRKWVENNSDQPFLLLSDYELINDKKTGLEIIEELNIFRSSILVTSHYKEIISKINGLKIIPKSHVLHMEIICEQTQI